MSQLKASNRRSLLSLLALSALLVGTACTGGGKDKPGKAVAGKTTKIGTPKPPFADPAPAEPMVVDGEIGKYGGTLVRAAAGNPKSLNPLLANESSSTEVLYGPVYATCWNYNNFKQEDEPGLCTKYERSEDGLTYTFHLRKGIRWSDGKPITAADFEFSYQVIIDPAISCSLKDLFKEKVGPDGKPTFPKFETIDPQTFKFTLTTPNVLFQSNVGSIYAVPKHTWEAVYKKGEFAKAMRLNSDLSNMPVSGPYRITKIDNEQRVVMTRNPYYWKVDKDGNRLPYIDRLIYVIVPDFNVKYLKFRDGETDVLEVRPEHIDPLLRGEKSGNYVVKDLGPAFNTNYLMFNLDPNVDKDGKPFVDPIKQKWFQSKNFRKAVSHAIDRDGIVRTVMSGRGQPLWTFYSPANKKWAPSKFEKYTYDLTKAKEYLAADGFVEKDGALHDKDGHRVEFSLMTNSENPTRIGMLNVIKDDLTKLGMLVHIRPVPFNDVVTSLRTSRNFEGLLLGWGSAVPPDPAQSKNVMLSSGASHSWNPKQKTPATPWEAKIDELVHKNTNAFEYAERKKYSDELLYIFSDEQPQIQLVVQTQFAAARSNLGNFNPSGLRPITLWNVEQLYFKTPKKR